MVRPFGQGALKRGFSPSYKHNTPLLGEGRERENIKHRAIANLVKKEITV